MKASEQLAALDELHRLLDRHRIEYWLFGGWAVDFHAGTVTRPHDDIDLAVWLEDVGRIAALLVSEGWTHAPEEGEDGYTGYARGAVRLELACCARAVPPGRTAPLPRTSASCGARAHGS